MAQQPEISRPTDDDVRDAQARRRSPFGLRWSVLLRGGPLIALLLLGGYFSLATPSFLTPGNLTNILNQTAFLAILAIGQTLVIAGAGIDLSVGSIMALGATSTAVLATHQFTVLGLTIGPLGPIVAILVGMGIGAAAGWVNGIVITKGRVPDFVITLAMMQAARGGALLITGGLPIPSYTRENEVRSFMPDPIVWMGGEDIAGIPTGPILMFIVLIVGWVILRKTRLGLSILSVGGNRKAAEKAGINVDRTKIISYTVMGLFAAIAGLVMTGRMTSANGLMGQGLELQSIAAVVIGGTNLFGGEASVISSVIGALVMGTLSNGFNLLGIPTFWQRVVIGVLLGGVVVFDQWRRRRFGT